MLCFEVFLGAHFLQSGHRPVELKAQPGSVVKRFWRLSSGGNQLDIAVVKFIHQIDKPPRRVLLVSVQPRNLLYQHGVVLASHFDIIGGAARLFTQSAKSCPGNTGRIASRLTGLWLISTDLGSPASRPVRDEK